MGAWGVVGGWMPLPTCPQWYCDLAFHLKMRSYSRILNIFALGPIFLGFTGFEILGPPTQKIWTKNKLFGVFALGAIFWVLQGLKFWGPQVPPKLQRTISQPFLVINEQSWHQSFNSNPKNFNQKQIIWGFLPLRVVLWGTLGYLVCKNFVEKMEKYSFEHSAFKSILSEKSYISGFFCSFV